MKEIGNAHWTSPNSGATNSSGFTALPGGYRADILGFLYLGNLAEFWSSTGSDEVSAQSQTVSYLSDGAYRNPFSKSFGFSVRCLKN